MSDNRFAAAGASEPMTTARMEVDPELATGEVSPRLFGSFVEHVGRCVYGGIFAPGDPAADEHGLRRDVIDLTRELGVSVIRYPGGNFVSGYSWEDGVGAPEARPARLDLAWHSIETNAFGLGEFMAWIGTIGAEPMLAVNLGTRTVSDAARLVEYANHPGGTTLSDLRREHGHDAPFDVKLWCLGNEMDGPWQLGHTSAEDYGRRAAEAAKMMRLVDPKIELVLCGSSGPDMPTFGPWERTVLEHAYEHVDYLSLHAYYEQRDGDVASFLATATSFENFILSTLDILDDAAAQSGSGRKLRLAVDEWNVWYQSHFENDPAAPWSQAPRLLEDEYDVADAVAVGSYLITLLRHADRIGVACQAQLVNVIAPIRTEPGEPAWRQTIFYPFSDAAHRAREQVLRSQMTSPTCRTDRYGDVPVLDAVATHDPKSGRVSVLAINRGTESPVSLEINITGTERYRLAEHRVLSAPDIALTNNFRHPNRVGPCLASTTQAQPGPPYAVKLPAVSWNAISFEPQTSPQED